MGQRVFVWLLMLALVAGCGARVVQAPPLDGAVEADATPVNDRASDAVSQDRGMVPDAAPDRTFVDAGSDVRVDDVSEDSSDAVVVIDGGDASTDRPVIREPTLTIIYNGPASNFVFGGRFRTIVYRFATQTERELVAEGLPIRITSTDGRALVSPSGEIILQNVRLVNEPSGRTIEMLPLRMRPGDTSLDFSAVGMIPIHAGEDGLAVAIDVPYTFDPMFDGTRFAVTVGAAGRFFYANSVHTSAGAVLAPEAIVGDVTIPGNQFTVRRPAVTIGLGSGPVVRTTVRRAPDVVSLEIPITVGVASDILFYDRFQIYGRGDTTGTGYEFARFDDVVNSCTLSTAAGVPLGVAMTPDPITGGMTFRGLRDVIRRGTTDVFRVSCRPDSVVENPMGDRYVIGMQGPTDVDVRDDVGPSPTVVIEDALRRQLTDPNPAAAMTVLRSGALTVSYDGSGERELPRTEGWIPVAPYRLSTTIKTQAIDRTAVTWTGPNACIDAVGVGSMGRLLGSAVPAAGQTTIDVSFDAPLLATLGAGTPLQVWVRFNPLSTECPSGTRMTFGLASGLTTGEWDRACPGYALRVTGTLSGDRICAEGVPRLGDAVILR